MIMSQTLTFLATSIAITSSAGAAKTLLPYQSPVPIVAPRIFEEGVISTRDDEFGGQFSLDGKTIWFSKSVPRFHLDTIFISNYQKGHWGSPEVAAFSGVWHDYDPTLSPDGKRLFFISDRPRAGNTDSKNYDIWYLDATADGWSAPKNLGSPINGDWSSHFAVVVNSGTLYFTSSHPGSKGWLDVWRSRFVNGQYEEPENLGDAINSAAWANFEVYVAPDERFMIVSAYGHDDSLGDCDLYVSYRRNGEWQPLKNLGPTVNSAARDYSARVTPDGRYLFFTSERGLPTTERSKPWTYVEFTNAIRKERNGLGDIYQIDLTAALRDTQSDELQ